MSTVFFEASLGNEQSPHDDFEFPSLASPSSPSEHLKTLEHELELKEPYTFDERCAYSLEARVLRTLSSPQDEEDGSTGTRLANWYPFGYTGFPELAIPSLFRLTLAPNALMDGYELEAAPPDEEDVDCILHDALFSETVLDDASLAMPQVLLTPDARATRENIITRVDSVDAPSSSAPTETTPVGVSSHRTPTSFYVSTSTELENEETHTDELSSAEQQAEGIVKSSATPVAAPESAVPESTQPSAIPAQVTSTSASASPVVHDSLDTAAQTALTVAQSETTPLAFPQATPLPSLQDRFHEEYPMPRFVSEEKFGNGEAVDQNESQVDRQSVAPEASLDQDHAAPQIEAIPLQHVQTLSQTTSRNNNEVDKNSASQAGPSPSTQIPVVTSYPGGHYHSRCGQYNARFPTTAAPSATASHSGSLSPISGPSTAATTPTAESPAGQSPVDGDSAGPPAKGGVTKGKGKACAEGAAFMTKGPYASRMHDIPKDGFGSWQAEVEPTDGSSSRNVQYQYQSLIRFEAQYQAPTRFEATSSAPIAPAKRKRDSEEHEHETTAEVQAFKCAAEDHNSFRDGPICDRQFTLINRAFFDHLWNDHTFYYPDNDRVRCPHNHEGKRCPASTLKNTKEPIRELRKGPPEEAPLRRK
ncbi:hypothetical protein DFP72DRAFT_849732 [Ephemerocybe angulata]|uniref:Uncharacterized protein n=1 Tax=Ephemerocybe angulata TaxID=980116 RepID=A0A8H6M5Y2_9AGAR|nr:hypothetical protein DFP72DRAFT_849732 [Tulosesus angulatus]